MKIRTLLMCAILAAPFIAQAQTIYTVVGSSICGPSTSTTLGPSASYGCMLTLSPSPLLSASVIQLYAVPYNTDTTNTGYMLFANTPGPTGGYLSSAVVDSTVVTGSNSVTLNLTGTYAPDSGGGVFTGSLNLNWAEITIKCGYHLLKRCPVIAVTGGVLEVNQ